ncbi:unnamed protein product [Paramecium sonneborni]|uniref:Uncharacterized protein n=1 Tax=Paramecium sonneborni TaxID=65129 RepID=A0A8S1R3A7_9CILI|nr:unnamed protein product [Paramecium sonneborni]
MSLIEFRELDSMDFDEQGQKCVKYLDSTNKQIGQGQYQQRQKCGQWKEVIEAYGKHLIIAEGNYIQGKKEGTWIYTLNDEQLGKKQFKQDKEIGCSFCYIIFQQPNISDDIWCLIDNFLLFENQRITQSFICNFKMFLQNGNYLMGGIKDGKWVELDQNSIKFDNQKKTYNFICSQGKYVQGVKEEIWESTFYEKYEHQEILHHVSKGKYISGKKNGIWTEPLGYKVKESVLTIIEGEYKNDLKVGYWKLEEGQDAFDQNDQYEYGGNYKNGLQINDWKEVRIFQNFYADKSIYIQDKGRYNNNGQRQNQWIFESSQEQGSCYYENGIIHGDAILFDCIGNYNIYLTRSKGKFNNGKKEGRWKKSIQVDERWILLEVGEYSNDIKVGQWRESQYLDQYSLERNERDKGQILLIKQGNYTNEGIKQGVWKWRFKCLTSNFNQNEIFNLSGQELHNHNTISGNQILFNQQFGEFYARFHFCDVFDGEIVDGYRNGEWRFSALENLHQNENNEKDTDSENEQQEEEEDVEVEENKNQPEENEEEQNNQRDENSDNNEEEQLDENDQQEQEINQQDLSNMVYQIYKKGILIN